MGFIPPYFFTGEGENAAGGGGEDPFFGLFMFPSSYLKDFTMERRWGEKSRAIWVSSFFSVDPPS